MATKKQTPTQQLVLARKHLARVQVAWMEPTDWDDLMMYGMHAVEAAIWAAALHLSHDLKLRDAWNVKLDPPLGLKRANAILRRGRIAKTA